MTWLVVAALAVLVVGVVGAWLIFAVLYRAVSNLFDWAILTFGNEAAVSRLADQRRESGRAP